MNGRSVSTQILSQQLQTAFPNPNSSAMFLNFLNHTELIEWKDTPTRGSANTLWTITSTSPSNFFTKGTQQRWKERSEQEFHVQELKVTPQTQPLLNSSNYTSLHIIYSQDETEYPPRTSMMRTVPQLASTKELGNRLDFAHYHSFSAHILGIREDKSADTNN